MIMEARRINPAILFPILFGFFVMGFVDVVGIATNYVKRDAHRHLDGSARP